MPKLIEMVRLLRDSFDSESYVHARRAIDQYREGAIAECPICGYVGRFTQAGTTMRFAGACPRCGSAERHRLVALALRAGAIGFAGKAVLHFAPERAISDIIKAEAPKSYLTGDILPGRADRVLNIEQLDLPSASVDVIMCSHVLEHVDDKRALGELNRVLTPGGTLLLLVPIVEGWSETYESAEVSTDHDRHHHFGQSDHIRYYGADFRDRVRAADFALDEFTAGGADSVRYALVRGEKIFIATKA